jgi:hypothetical protein
MGPYPLGSPDATSARAAIVWRDEVGLSSRSSTPELTRVAMLEQHPMAWLVEVDGLIVDARMLPAEVRDEARRRGLIPDLDALRAA